MRPIEPIGAVAQPQSPVEQPIVAPSDRTTEQRARQSSLVWPIVVMAGMMMIAAALFFRGGRNNGGGGDDSRTPPALTDSQVVTEATIDYVLSLAEAMDGIAAKVDSGEIENWEHLKTNVRAWTAEARAQSFAPIDVVDTKRIPEGNWDESQRSQVSTHLRMKATSHRAAVKQ